jgi:hypothetical protein
MPPFAEITSLVLQNLGKLCSAHWNTVAGVVCIKWARVCETDEEAEMIDCEFENAAVPGQPYGVRFEGIANYRSDNQDNLQVSRLVDFRILAGGPEGRCFIRFDDSLDAVGAVEFSFEKYSLLFAPKRK